VKRFSLDVSGVLINPPTELQLGATERVKLRVQVAGAIPDAGRNSGVAIRIDATGIEDYLTQRVVLRLNTPRVVTVRLRPGAGMTPGNVTLHISLFVAGSQFIDDPDHSNDELSVPITLV
jgi:hypothetical protein